MPAGRIIKYTFKEEKDGKIITLNKESEFLGEKLNNLRKSNVTMPLDVAYKENGALIKDEWKPGEKNVFRAVFRFGTGNQVGYAIGKIRAQLDAWAKKDLQQEINKLNEARKKQGRPELSGDRAREHFEPSMYLRYQRSPHPTHANQLTIEIEGIGYDSYKAILNHRRKMTEAVKGG